MASGKSASAVLAKEGREGSLGGGGVCEARRRTTGGGETVSKSGRSVEGGRGLGAREVGDGRRGVLGKGAWSVGRRSSSVGRE